MVVGLGMKNVEGGAIEVPSILLALEFVCQQLCLPEMYIDC